MRQLLLAAMVLASATGGCLGGEEQVIEVRASVVDDPESIDEPVVPYDEVDDEITRRMVRQSVEAHETENSSLVYEDVPESEFQDPHFEEEGDGYVSYEGHVVNVIYTLLD